MGDPMGSSWMGDPMGSSWMGDPMVRLVMDLIFFFTQNLPDIYINGLELFKNSAFLNF